MLKNRLIEFESLKDNILLRIEKLEADVEKMDKNKIERCVDCNIDIHRASYSRHLKTKGHLEKNQTKSKTTKIKKDKNENNKIKNKIEYKFTDDISNKIYDITVDRHLKKELNSQITIASKFDDTGIEMYYINEIFNEMSHVYAKNLNQYKFKYQLSFMLLFNKIEENGDIKKEVEMTITLNMAKNLTPSEIENVNIQWDLEARKQNLEMRES